jgi:hypothetical protein
MATQSATLNQGNGTYRHQDSGRKLGGVFLPFGKLITGNTGVRLVEATVFP